VRTDEAPLGGVERSALLQDHVRNGELADVVKLCGEPQFLEFVELEEQPLTNAQRKRRDIRDMGAELRLSFGERAQQGLCAVPRRKTSSLCA
jgi:hypothetical protein